MEMEMEMEMVMVIGMVQEQKGERSLEVKGEELVAGEAGVRFVCV